MTPEPSPARPYSRRRMTACFVAALALIAVLVFDHTAATVHAAQPLGSPALNGGLPLTVAHRGDPVAAPENTMPAFESALRAGVDVLELDLQLSADGHAVIIHDETVDRTTNGSGEIAALSLAELQSLDAGSWYGSAWHGVTIPTFTEFLPLLQRSRASAIIEFKGVWPAEGITPVIAAIYRFGVQDRVVLASFEAETLLELWREAPSLQRAIIVRRLPADPVELAVAHGATAVITSMRSFQVEPEAAQELRGAGLMMIVYTLNRADLWLAARELGVDAIVTDSPRRLAQTHAALRD